MTFFRAGHRHTFADLPNSPSAIPNRRTPGFAAALALGFALAWVLASNAGCTLTTPPPDVASIGCDPWLDAEELARRDCPVASTALAPTRR